MYLLFVNFFILLLLIMGCGGENKKLDVVNTPNKTVVKVDEKPLETNSKKLELAKTVIDKINYKPNTKLNTINIFDTSFESTSSNNLLGSNTSFDTDIKRSGNRSVKLDQTEDMISIYNISVNEGSWYMISGYMYTNTLPSDVVRLYIGYTNDKGHVFSVSYPVISISKAGDWEEFTVPLYIQKDKDISDIKIIIRNVGKPHTTIAPIGDVWIDDLSIREVKDSTQLFGLNQPADKQAFNGAKTRMDSLGNIEFKIDGEFKPYFPLIIYPSGELGDWTRYKKQGFNTIICNNPDEAQFAVSLGLNWIWDLHGYGINDNIENEYDRFVKEFNDLKSNSPKLLEKLLYYYWDNEKYLVFDTIKKFSDKIKTMDTDENGLRNRPIYMHLDFTSGSKNYFNEKFKIIDMQGTYANPLLYKNNDVFNYGYEFKDYYNAEFANFCMFENIPNSSLPKSIFVINSPQDIHLENTIFAALARGGRGFGFWKDGGSQPDVKTRPWWDSFPNIVNKINKLKPLLKTPHWTNWDLEYTLKDDEDGLVVGKRDYDSKRCMIFSSRSAKEEVVIFSTPDKDISQVYNFFDNSIVGQGVGKSIRLNFAPKQSGVYCWN